MRRYTYKAMGSAFCAYRNGKDFRSEIEKLVLEAGDADTNGIVAGSLLGCKLGYSKLPKEWLDDLLEKEWLECKVSKLLVMMGLK
jgi:ADP-ribosylglycohydrolase